MKIIYLATLFTCSTLLLSSHVFASPLALATPDKCPSVDSIKKVGLIVSDKDEDDGVYVVGQVNNYDTHVTWSFDVVVPMSKATCEEDALNKARAALPALSGNPMPLPYHGKWLCVYNELMAEGYKTVAMTPATIHKEILKS